MVLLLPYDPAQPECTVCTDQLQYAVILNWGLVIVSNYTSILKQCFAQDLGFPKWRLYDIIIIILVY